MNIFFSNTVYGLWSLCGHLEDICNTEIRSTLQKCESPNHDNLQQQITQLFKNMPLKQETVLAGRM